MAEVYVINKAVKELIYYFPDLSLESLSQNIQMLSMGPCLRTCYILLCPSLSHMKFLAGQTLLLCQAQGGSRSRTGPRPAALFLLGTVAVTCLEGYC